MPTTAIYCGVILILIGLTGYFYGRSTGAASWTALIPAILGGVLAILGAAARRHEGPRKHLMHGAVIVAFLGFLATIGNIFRTGGVSTSVAGLSTLITAIICLIFVVLALRSFIAARSSPPSE